MSKYQPLYNFLAKTKRIPMTMSFQQIELLLGFSLPVTARKRNQWWANEINQNTTHVQCRAWRNAGFVVRNLDLAAQSLDFVPVA